MGTIQARVAEQLRIVEAGPDVVPDVVLEAAPTMLSAPETFDELYTREYEPMLRIAYLLVLDRELALDVTHDAFARVYERWSRLDRPGGYLRTAVVNSARDSVRRRHYRRSRQHIVDFDAGGADPAGEQPDYLLDALSRLHPRRRAAIVLRYYLDASEAESAEALGVRPGTVKSLLSRGLADLRIALAEPEHPHTTHAGSRHTDSTEQERS